MFGTKISVYTPKGDIVELPKELTPIDYVYKIHTDISDTMVYEIVNNRKVDEKYSLQNKDRVIIIEDLSYSSRENWQERTQANYTRKKTKEFNRK